MIEPFLKGIDMVVLDNISNPFCRTGKENEGSIMAIHAGVASGYAAQGHHGFARSSCGQIRRPARHKRQRGHHGHSDQAYAEPREYAMAEGARFEVHLTKPEA